MTKSLVVCPSCGREVPEGVYCNICGSELTAVSPPEPPLESTGEMTPIREEEEDLLESTSLPHFGVTIEGVPSDAAAVLLSRAELEVIDSELDRIIRQTKATRQALTLQQADRKVLMERAERLRQEFEETKSRKGELLELKQTLRLEQILQELNRQEKRLEKLQAIEGSVDKEVFNEQRVEILQQIKALRDALKSARKDAKKWTKGLEKTLKSLNKEVSRVDARFKIGDIQRREYDSRMYELRRNILIVEGSRKRLDTLLIEAKNK
ncbi:MAG: hypothetical protein ACP6KW_04670 [Candidatus Thorarchaeota archaeon]